MSADALHWSLMAWSRRRKLGLLVVGALVALPALYSGSFLTPEDDPQCRAAFDRIRIGMTAAEAEVAIYPETAASAAVADRPGWMTYEMSAYRQIHISVMPFKVEASRRTESPGRLRIHFDKNLRVDAKRIESGIWWWDALLRLIGV
jgi:hypothetical protein